MPLKRGRAKFQHLLDGEQFEWTGEAKMCFFNGKLATSGYGRDTANVTINH